MRHYTKSNHNKKDAFNTHNFQIGFDTKLKALFCYLNPLTKRSSSIKWIVTIPILSIFCDRKC